MKLKVRDLLWHKKSIVVKVSAVIAAILAAMIFLLVCYNIYSYRIAMENVEEQQNRVMSVRIQQMYGVLKSAATTLDELASGNLENIEAFKSDNGIQQYLSQKGIGDALSAKTNNTNGIGCIYFINREHNIYLLRYGNTLSWTQKIALMDYVNTDYRPENDVVSNAWHIVRVDNTNYLYQNYGIASSDIGLLISLDDLLNKSTGTSAKSTYLLTNEDGLTLTSEDKTHFPINTKIANHAEVVNSPDKPYTVFSQQLSNYGLRLSCVIEKENIYRGALTMQYILIGFSFLILLIILAFSQYLSRSIVLPVKKLVVATQEIEHGNIDYHISETDKDAQEFSMLISSFNKMTQEIKDLKIQTYEETLERKNAELKYLQMQLRPHFYLNAIATISSLSMCGQNKQIQEFIAALSSYLRYLFTDNLAKATISSEMLHAVNYLRLQQIRYPDHIFFFDSVEAAVENVPIQKLLLQTFVENIFKHAFDGEKSISIFLRAQKLSRNGENFALITIEDSGCGFPEEILRTKSGENASAAVGIANIAKTLELAYERDDLLYLSNSKQGGAHVDIYIPLTPSEGEKNEFTNRGR